MDPEELVGVVERLGLFLAVTRIPREGVPGQAPRTASDADGP